MNTRRNIQDLAAPCAIVVADQAACGATKVGIQFEDKRIVEAVRIPCSEEIKICVSSQVGCAHHCRFCITGTLGLGRNLSYHEIVAQVVRISEEYGDDIADYHVIFMGMGEPFLNVRNVVKAVQTLENGPVHVRDITVSTSGVPDAIRSFSQVDTAATLAVSIVATDPVLREQLMPHTTRFSLDDVVSATIEYQLLTGKRVILEYVLLDGVNDSVDQVTEFVRATRDWGLDAEIQFIPYNPSPGLGFTRPSDDHVEMLLRITSAIHPDVRVKRSAGADVSAGCGQLISRSSTDS